MASMNYFDCNISNKTNTVVQVDERRKLMFMDYFCKNLYEHITSFFIYCSFHLYTQIKTGFLYWLVGNSNIAPKPPNPANTPSLVVDFAMGLICSIKSLPLLISTRQRDQEWNQA
jgi:hypothetical protein